MDKPFSFFMDASVFSSGRKLKSTDEFNNLKLNIGIKMVVAFVQK